MAQADSSFFEAQAKGQAPTTLWLGCADSRVPETTLLGLKPGDVFVHRNIANIIPATDLSSASVIEYGVAALGVKQIIVCGHTSCGGCAGALGNNRIGKIDLWLQPLRALRAEHAEALAKLPDAKAKGDALSELNVKQGVKTVRQHPDVIAAAKSRGLQVHGMMFDLASGEVRVVDTTEDSKTQAATFEAFAT